MRTGDVAALALGASGVAIALLPRKALAALELSPLTARGLTETRAGLGGTFAGLGLWAAARGSSDAYTVVGVTWLGAAAVRTWSMQLDRPVRSPSLWAYLAGETVLGTAGVLARSRR